MMRFFQTSIKQVVALRRTVQSGLATAIVMVTAGGANAAVGDGTVFSEMGELAGSARDGLSANVIGVIGALALLVLGGAYFLGQSQFAKQYQKQIVVGGVVVALSGSILAYFGLTG